MNSEDSLNIDVPNNGIINMLLTLENGNLVSEADQAIHDLVALVKRRGGVGKMQLTISISELKKNPGVHNIEYNFKIVEPPRDRASSIMFADRSMGLITFQPEQRDLGFEPVTDEKVTPINHKKDD